MERGVFYNSIKIECNERIRKVARRQNKFYITDYARSKCLNNDNQIERKEAFGRLEQIRKKGTVVDYNAELASYRDEKYDK